MEVWLCTFFVGTREPEVGKKIIVILFKNKVQFSSVTHLCPSNPIGLQHARFPCRSPTQLMSMSLARWWCHLAISSSVIPFSSCLQSFQASGSFQMSQFFTSDSQSIGVSASASVLPVNIQNWFPLRMDWLDLLAVQGTVKSLLQHHSSKASILRHSAFFIVQLSHQYMTTGKIVALTRRTSAGKCLCFLICYIGWTRKRKRNLM